MFWMIVAVFLVSLVVALYGRYRSLVIMHFQGELLYHRDRIRTMFLLHEVALSERNITLEHLMKQAFDYNEGSPEKLALYHQLLDMEGELPVIECLHECRKDHETQLRRHVSLLSPAHAGLVLAERLLSAPATSSGLVQIIHSLCMRIMGRTIRI